MTELRYYSFSPSRADQAWEFFKHDIPALRSWVQRQAGEEGSEEVPESEGPLKKKREEIFHAFEEEGFYIPGIAWDREDGMREDGTPFHLAAEEKMQYLMDYGCLYQKGVWPDKTPDAPFKMLFLGDKSEYKDLLRVRDRASRDAKKEIRRREPNRYQRTLLGVPGVSYLFQAQAYDETALIQALIACDLHYGCISDGNFSEPEAEQEVYAKLSSAFGVPAGSPSKHGILEIFTKMSAEIVQKAAEELAREYEGETSEAMLLIRNYLTAAKPVARDLKNTADAVFIRIAQDGIATSEASSMLQARAEKHRQENLGLLPPLL